MTSAGNASPECSHPRRRLHDRYGEDRRPRWKCTHCGRTFSESRDTPLFRSRVGPETLLEILVLVEERWPTRRIAQLAEVSPATVARVTRLASEKVPEMRQHLTDRMGVEAPVADRICRVLLARRAAREAWERRRASHATSATGAMIRSAGIGGPGVPNGDQEDSQSEGHREP